MKIYQGDQYAIPITVKRNNTVQTSANIVKLEVIFAGLRKTYPGEIIYHSQSQKFLFPLDQSESMALDDDTYTIYARPHYTDGTISGWNKGSVTVIPMEDIQEI